jgi:prefoldin subunit 5
MKSTDTASGPSGMQAASPKLSQELQMYKSALESLDEELRQSKSEAEKLLATYRDLYDFSPVG